MFFFSRTFISYIHISYLKCEHIIRKNYQKQLNQAEITTELILNGTEFVGMADISYINSVRHQICNNYMNLAVTNILSIKIGLSTSTKKKNYKTTELQSFCVIYSILICRYIRRSENEWALKCWQL